MIYIFCGENILESRNQFYKYKKYYKSKSYILKVLDKNSLHIDSIMYSPENLFSEKYCYTGENICSLKENIKLLVSLQDKDIPILLWEENKKKTSFTKSLSKAVVSESKFPVTLWKLLDSIYPKNLKTVINNLNTVGDQIDEHIILFMIQKTTKQMIIAHKESKLLTKLASWQIGKITSQAKKWEFQKLADFNDGLYRIEVASKTNSTPYSIHQALDILFCLYLR